MQLPPKKSTRFNDMFSHKKCFGDLIRDNHVVLNSIVGLLIYEWHSTNDFAVYRFGYILIQQQELSSDRWANSFTMVVLLCKYTFSIYCFVNELFFLPLAKVLTLHLCLSVSSLTIIVLLRLDRIFTVDKGKLSYKKIRFRKLF